ncbi:SgcJ/EcaC family oxidoreductase [Bradyrhizobium lablabi]|uniref:SgcJ/EcaC family oxidoreductase n=1 Tax=Bradyrhizobium lablabi TaxID=722472 RepID=UPI001BAD62F1|nr:SgcJ/EcaC family oxidoreductase [Bradyrhizobium lablabi]MBR0697897.1 SgcJ/EcaC family oxidoreductase [Bradyrhizobium lablabi]
MSPAVASAGPAEDANAAVDRWSAAYSGNDPDLIARQYWPDAILLGTVSPVISEGTQAIATYFAQVKGTGNKNSIEERRTIPINDRAVVVAGFYTFTRMVEGKATPAPSRFTMLVTRQGDEWRIAHHHSSPHVQPKN